MSRPLKAKHFTSSGEQEMTLVSSEEMQSMVSALEKNLNNTSDELKARLRSLIISQLSLIRYKHRDYDVKYVHARANGADIQQYTIENLPRGQGQSLTDALIDDLLQARGNDTLELDQVLGEKGKDMLSTGSRDRHFDVSVEEERNTLSPSSGGESDCGTVTGYLAKTLIDGVDDEADNSRPPTVSAIIEPRNTLSPVHSPNKIQPSSDPVAISYTHSCNNKPCVCNCKVVVGKTHQMIRVNNAENVQCQPTVNVNVKIKKHNGKPPLVERDRLVDKERENQGSEAEYSADLEETKEDKEASNQQIDNVVTTKVEKSDKPPKSTPRSTGWQKLRKHQRATPLTQEKEVPTKVGKSKSSERWAKLRDHLASGKLMLKDEISNQHRTSQTTSDSVKMPEGWHKLKNRLKTGKLMLEKDLSTKHKSGPTQTNPIKSDGLQKLKRHLEASDLLHRKEASINKLDNIDNQVSNYSLDTDSATPVSSEISSDTPSVVYIRDNTSTEDIREETPKKGNTKHTALTSKTLGRWRKLQERLKYRKTAMEHDTPSSNETGTSKHDNYDYEANPDYNIDLQLGRSRQTSATSRTSLARIRDLVTMLTELSESSVDDDATKKRREDAQAELADIYLEVQENIQAFENSKTKIDANRSGTIHKETLHKRTGSEVKEPTGLDNAMNQLASAQTSGVVEYDEAVLHEIRDLLPLVYDLASLPPTASKHDPRPAKSDTLQSSTTEVPTRSLTQTVPAISSIFTRSFGFMKSFIQKETKVDDTQETSQAKVHVNESRPIIEEAPARFHRRLGGAAVPLVDKLGNSESTDSTQDEQGNFNSHNGTVTLSSRYSRREQNQDGRSRTTAQRPINQPSNMLSYISISGLMNFRRVTRTIVGFVGLILLLLFSTNFGGSILTTWLYAWAFMSCNVRLVHSSPEPVV